MWAWIASLWKYRSVPEWQSQTSPNSVSEKALLILPWWPISRAGQVFCSSLIITFIFKKLKKNKFFSDFLLCFDVKSIKSYIKILFFENIGQSSAKYSWTSHAKNDRGVCDKKQKTWHEVLFQSNRHVRRAGFYIQMDFHSVWTWLVLSWFLVPWFPIHNLRTKVHEGIDART